MALDTELLALYALAAGGPNWRDAARRLDASGVPLPNSPGFSNLLNPSDGTEGNVFLAQDTGVGAFARPDLQLTPPAITENPPPVTTPRGITTDTMPEGLGGAGETGILPPGVTGAEGNILDFLTGAGAGPGNPPPPTTDELGSAFGDNLGSMFTPPATRTPPGGLERAISTGGTGDRRFPNVRMPEAIKPEFRGGVAGAQKAPDFGMKASASPAQALMAILMGNQGKNPLRVPALGQFLGGSGGGG